MKSFFASKELDCTSRNADWSTLSTLSRAPVMEGWRVVDEEIITDVGGCISCATTMWSGCIAIAETLATRIWNGPNGRTLTMMCAVEVVRRIAPNILGSTIFIPETLVVTKNRCLLSRLRRTCVAIQTGCVLPLMRVKRLRMGVVRGCDERAALDTVGSVKYGHGMAVKLGDSTFWKVAFAHEVINERSLRGHTDGFCCQQCWTILERLGQLDGYVWDLFHLCRDLYGLRWANYACINLWRDWSTVGGQTFNWRF